MATRPRQGSLHTCAVAIQPIQASIDLRGDAAFVDKTDGCNQDECVWERTAVYKPRKGELEPTDSNGWCRRPCKTNIPVGKGKCSVVVRAVASKGFRAMPAVRGGGASHLQVPQSMVEYPAGERHWTRCIMCLTRHVASEAARPGKFRIARWSSICPLNRMRLVQFQLR